MKHVDRTFILLLWGGLVGVLFYGCGRDASISLTNGTLSPRVRLLISSENEGEGALLDANGKTLMSHPGMSELSFDRGSSLVLKPKPRKGSKFIGWNVEPSSSGQVTDDNRLIVADVSDHISVEAKFEKLTTVKFQVVLNENKTQRGNLVLWRVYLPGNSTSTPNYQDYFPRDLERGRTDSKVFEFPYGTRIEVDGNKFLAPFHENTEFVLDQENVVLRYTIDPNYR